MESLLSVVVVHGSDGTDVNAVEHREGVASGVVGTDERRSWRKETAGWFRSVKDRIVVQTSVAVEHHQQAIASSADGIVCHSMRAKRERSGGRAEAQRIPLAQRQSGNTVELICKDPRTIPSSAGTGVTDGLCMLHG